MRAVMTTFALVVAFATAAALAQATTSAAAAQEAPAVPQPPTVAFTTPTGILLVQIKPDKTAVFEEMVTKLKAGLAKSQDATLKSQASGIRFYKSAQPFGINKLYVVMVEPAVAASEYDFFQMIAKTMTPDELRAPETAEMWKKYQDAFPTGMTKLDLTLLGA
jgi:hypothetical protein